MSQVDIVLNYMFMSGFLANVSTLKLKAPDFGSPTMQDLVKYDVYLDKFVMGSIYVMKYRLPREKPHSS